MATNTSINLIFYKHFKLIKIQKGEQACAIFRAATTPLEEHQTASAEVNLLATNKNSSIL
ncbi:MULTISPECIES: hypothetical protein [Pseudomonas]|uniref:Uncharacterized protein n=1 Tax=Pseudomonas mosselii TaxID=78327 RepID=A0A5R8Z8H9_9PSED|nr:hypothetical protein [Pseudomonas mosselii]TLP61834.1 hypothetical protein FEM01_10105 [Pseudomonas mosselii]